MQRSMQNSDKEVSGLSSEDLLWDKLSNNIRKRILNLTFRALVYCLPEHFSALTSKGALAKNLEKKDGTMDREHDIFISS